MAVPTTTPATTVATRMRNKKEAGGRERAVETAVGAEAVVGAVAVMTVQEGATYGGKSFERAREEGCVVAHAHWLTTRHVATGCA